MVRKGHKINEAVKVNQSGWITTKELLKLCDVDWVGK